ncbi:anti-sigma factor antagonist [Actinomycetospora termitidis]|uniref:Anti-sigma factor antagonist n=1 Tax=Actinomycetospora termitidis TaxID=3053470 RepID=A0ABT7MIQ3_9PSEU|nr:anti-sigma factor antagonist [Actinomycetospora sp. Odt1-22]MDL5160552.1 anti-sigma factor antagonist [Actinomycetospora sp. Odt1-22]
MHPDRGERSAGDGARPAPDPGTVEVAVRDTDDGVAVVAVAGDVDGAAAATLRAGVERAATDARAVVLDLDDVALLASAGMTLLLEITEDLRGRGVPVLLASQARTVRRPLRITGLDRVLTLHDDVASARAAAGDGADHG